MLENGFPCFLSGGVKTHVDICGPHGNYGLILPESTVMRKIGKEKKRKENLGESNLLGRSSKS